MGVCPAMCSNVVALDPLDCNTAPSLGRLFCSETNFWRQSSQRAVTGSHCNARQHSHMEASPSDSKGLDFTFIDVMFVFMLVLRDSEMWCCNKTKLLKICACILQLSALPTPVHEQNMSFTKLLAYAMNFPLKAPRQVDLRALTGCWFWVRSHARTNIKHQPCSFSCWQALDAVRGGLQRSRRPHSKASQNQQCIDSSVNICPPSWYVRITTVSVVSHKNIASFSWRTSPQVIRVWAVPSRAFSVTTCFT